VECTTKAHLDSGVHSRGTCRIVVHSNNILSREESRRIKQRIKKDKKEGEKEG
jgi:hypothetical protein